MEYGESTATLGKYDASQITLRNDALRHSGRVGNRQVYVKELHPARDCSPDPVPSLVYDPFLGSGTTVLVARQLRRHGIGGDLSAAYLDIARERLGLKALAAWEGRTSAALPLVVMDDLPLFTGGILE